MRAATVVQVLQDLFYVLLHVFLLVIVFFTSYHYTHTQTQAEPPVAYRFAVVKEDTRRPMRQLKMQDLEIHDLEMTHQIAWLENAQMHAYDLVF